jgi:hypothetical protein
MQALSTLQYLESADYLLVMQNDVLNVLYVSAPLLYRTRASHP